MKHTVQITLAVVALSVAILVAPLSATADDNEDNIREIIEVTNALQMAEQFVAPMLQGLADIFIALNPDSADFVHEVIVVEMQQAFRDNMSDLGELLVIAYRQQFTPTEVSGLLAFYKSPLGQTMIAKTPAIVADMQAAGGTWGEALGLQAYDRIIERLRKEGLDVPA